MANDRPSSGAGGPSVAELAAQPLDDRDVAILDQIATAYSAADPVPEGLVERLQFAMTLDALDAEIARLTRMDDLVGARAEAASEVQTITFTSQSLTTMITITPSGADRVRVDGWVADGAAVDIELRTEASRLHVQADEDGRFVFEDVPRGMAQFVLRRPDADLPWVITPAIEI
jgi:hypothetical protein